MEEPVETGEQQEIQASSLSWDMGDLFLVGLSEESKEKITTIELNYKTKEIMVILLLFYF